MSMARTFTIQCDECWYDGGLDDEPKVATHASLARDLALDGGWYHRNGKDLCPFCADPANKEENQ